jgi:hypothetical protein
VSSLSLSINKNSLDLNLPGAANPFKGGITLAAKDHNFYIARLIVLLEHIVSGQRLTDDQTVQFLLDLDEFDRYPCYRFSELRHGRCSTPESLNIPPAFTSQTAVSLQKKAKRE